MIECKRVDLNIFDKIILACANRKEYRTFLERKEVISTEMGYVKAKNCLESMKNNIWDLSKLRNLLFEDTLLLITVPQALKILCLTWLLII